MTTVTVVEDFDQVRLENAETISKPGPSSLIKTAQTSERSKPLIESKKKRAFRYGTKAERRAEKRKSKVNRHRHKRKWPLKDTGSIDTLLDTSMSHLYSTRTLPLESIGQVRARAGILFPLLRFVSGPTLASLLHSASNRKKIHIQRRTTSSVSITNIPPSSSLTWCRCGDSLILHVNLSLAVFSFDTNRRSKSSTTAA